MELKINQLKETIITGINNSELPLSLVSYVLKDIIVEVDALRNQELKQEAEALAKSQTESADIEIVE